MILPVGDINERKTSAVVTYLFIAVNLVVFVWMWILLPQEKMETSSKDPEAAVIESVTDVVDRYALVPAKWEWDSVRSWRSAVTHMFLHGGLFHLLGNLLFLFIAGPSVEDRLGHGIYAVFYLVCGFAGAIVHILFARWMGDPTMPMVGASGAISGVIGAYLLFFPRSQIKFALVLVIFIRYFNLPSWGAIGLWLGMQVLMAMPQLRGEAATTNVAVMAHLGGFAMGFLLAFYAALFGRGRQAKKK